MIWGYQKNCSHFLNINVQFSKYLPQMNSEVSSCTSHSFRYTDCRLQSLETGSVACFDEKALLYCD